MIKPMDIKTQDLIGKSADELERLLRDADFIRYEARFERGTLLKRIEQTEKEIASIKQEETYSCIKKENLETNLKIYRFALMLVEAENLLTTKI
jgi:DNA polymerase III epsilon subunit-like protein